MPSDTPQTPGTTRSRFAGLPPAHCLTNHSLWLAFFAMLIALLFYSQYWERTGGHRIERDPLNRKVFSMGKNCCSWWPITHLLFYMVLGFFFPDCWLLILSVGVVWEGIEEAMAMFSGRESSSSAPLSESTQYSKTWWGGSLTDILFNTVGFVIGAGIKYLSDTSRGGPWGSPHREWPAADHRRHRKSVRISPRQQRAWRSAEQYPAFD